VNVLSLAYFVLMTGIARFSGALPKNMRVLPILSKREALGVESQKKWRFDEAPGTKRSKNGSCSRRTVSCRVCTTVL